MMHLDAHVVVPFFAAVIAGALNSAAGGGSFVSFPALLLVGYPPIAANATNNAAMWLGGLGSIGGFREDLTMERRDAIPAILVGIAGGAIGGVLLLRTPESDFQHAIPYLLGFATIVFAASPWLRGANRIGNQSASFATLLPLFCVALYGGYFGAGIGIMILALFAATTAMDLRQINALKNFLTFFINGTAVIPFAIAHAVVWPEGLLMAVGAVGGAYGGARVIRRLPPVVVRAIVITIGAGMSIYFLVHG